LSWKNCSAKHYLFLSYKNGLDTVLQNQLNNMGWLATSHIRSKTRKETAIQETNQHQYTVVGEEKDRIEPSLSLFFNGYAM
jgi:hypothetical protein